MRGRRLAGLALVAAAVLGALALLVSWLETDAFRDAPDDFVEVRDGPLSFRHSPEWRVERAPEGLTVTAPSGPGVAMVRRTARDGKAALLELEAGLNRLRRGRRESTQAYELDLPGRGDVEVLDEVYHRGRGVRERVESLVLPNGAGGLVHFMVRGPVSEDPETDPRAITGTLRLED